MIQITDLRPGSLISAPGFYQLPMELHHAQPCVGPSVTSGGLRRIEKHGAEYFWEFWSGNEDRAEDKDSKAKRFGRAIATFMESGVEGLRNTYKFKPHDAPPRPTATQVKAFERDGFWSDNAIVRAQFYEIWDEDTREEMDAADMENIVAMMTKFAEDPAAELVVGGIPELDIVWEDEETGLWCLSRLDIVGLDGVLIDHKTVSPGMAAYTESYVDRKITDLGYYQQLAFAWEGWTKLIGQEPTAAGVFMQRTDRPWSTILRNVTPEAIEIGAYQNRRARRKIRECLDTGVWPGPGEKLGNYQMHEAIEKRLRQEMAVDPKENRHVGD